MSRRKASNSRRIDNDFDRNGRFLTTKEGDSVNNSKQLFDPHSDNPLKFNKPKQETSSPTAKSLSRREESPMKRQEPIVRRDDYRRDHGRESSSPRQEESPRRVPATGRRLWTPDDGQRVSQQTTAPPKQKQVSPSALKIMSNSNTRKSNSISPKTIISKKAVSNDVQKEEQPKQEVQPKEQPTTAADSPTKITDSPTKITDSPTTDIATEEEEEEQKPQEISEEQEAHRKKLKSLITSIRQIEGKLETLSTSSRSLPCFSDNSPEDRQDRKAVTKPTPLLQSISEQDIQAANDIWKEKIRLHLSLAEEYLQVMQCDLEYAEKKGLESLCWKRAVYSLVDQFRRALKKSADMLADHNKTKPPENKLAAMLFDDEEEQVVPVIHEGGGMTFIKVETTVDDSVKKEELHVEQTKMILANFLTYLDLADDFYLKLTQFLKSLDDDADDDIETCLAQWRRVQRYKWYACVPLRGDIARYRWVYTSDDDTSSWTKHEAFEQVWRRYYLGIWLMPAKGNLYFNLSLLLQQPPPQNTQGHEFHKLYFSTRSLMVRRNGFMNARESMLALFESNRRWIQKYVQSDTTNKKHKKSTTPKKYLRDKKDATVPALFVRLHGMLFTKIGLDEFSKIRRIFFDILFERKAVDYRQTEQETSIEQQLSSDHLFWIEMVIMCLSSLYTYNFASSQLCKLLSLNSKRLFYGENTDQFKQLADEMNDNILFAHGIDLTCQVAVELFQRYLDPNIPQPIVPQIPELPHVSLNFKENKEFLFGERKTTLAEKKTQPKDTLAWLIYIEILLHWMVLDGICIRTKDQPSLWELTIGDIGYDLVAYQKKRFVDMLETSKISPAFWPLLLQFLNQLLSELPEETKYDMVNKHLMDDEDGADEIPADISESEYVFAKNIMNILGEQPDLPEEDHLRGLGWVDDIHGRFLKLNPTIKKEEKPGGDILKRRKLKILEYGFTLVKHLEDILLYDPVEEVFTLSKSVEERASELEKEKETESIKPVEKDEEEQDVIMTSIAEMDDDVLLSSETEIDELNEGDDITTQLKKRREQLQSIIATAEAEERFGYRRLPNRVKEREARLNYLRERIIPGKTILVLDTNCFIGHIDYVERLFEAQKWSIIVPLVVVTELDGLKTNTHRLGRVAQEGIELLETTLANKPKQSTSLRIQTSHNNFMNDISIRSEHFVFGETDKNLDDLILSSCLWWISQQPATKDSNDKTVPVCLVTGDRNLSVKARARDVEVVPVSAVIQLTPK